MRTYKKMHCTSLERTHRLHPLLQLNVMLWQELSSSSDLYPARVTVDPSDQRIEQKEKKDKQFVSHDQGTVYISLGVHSCICHHHGDYINIMKYAELDISSS